MAACATCFPADARVQVLQNTLDRMRNLIEARAAESRTTEPRVLMNAAEMFLLRNKHWATDSEAEIMATVNGPRMKLIGNVGQWLSGAKRLVGQIFVPAA